MRKKEYILLNGQKVDADNVETLNTRNFQWEQDIYFFLKNWFDNTDFVTVHTSGSTGKPKKIKMAKETMRSSARMTNDFFGLNASKKALLCLPASYIAGKMMLVRAIEGGFKLHTSEPVANPFKNTTEAIDFVAITPYQLQYSIENLKFVDVKNIIVGGGQISPQLVEKTEALSASIYETYGMTETASHIALRKINGKDKSEFFSVLNGVSIKQDSNKCLIINAPQLVDKEINTNDIVEMIDENSFKWLGRIDNVINSGGVKIFPEEVEKKLSDFITDNYFIASITDEIFGNKVILIIESEKYPDEKESLLIKKMYSGLHKYEIPKHIFYISNFVYSFSNKILKKETLKKIYM